MKYDYFVSYYLSRANEQTGPATGFRNTGVSFEKPITLGLIKDIEAKMAEQASKLYGVPVLACALGCQLLSAE